MVWSLSAFMCLTGIMSTVWGAPGYIRHADGQLHVGREELGTWAKAIRRLRIHPSLFLNSDCFPQRRREIQL